MQINIKDFMKLTGVTANHVLVSNRNITRKQERRLRKKLVGKMTPEEIKNIAKIHPVGDVEVINLS